MPNKLKSRKSAVKRFKLTAGGKLLHRGHGSRHLKSSKTKKQLRHLNAERPLDNLILKKKIIRMLGK